jgi:hypothetical protein
MLMTQPRVRISGHGSRLRVRTKGDWQADPLGALREACRSSVAIEKALAEAIQHARVAGVSWAEVGRALGVAEAADDKDALIDAFAISRRLILHRQLRDVT